MNLTDNISIILKIVSKLQMLSFYGCGKWDGMVITGHRYSKSTFGGKTNALLLVKFSIQSPM